MASTEPERRHWTETDACFFPAKQRDRGTWWMEGGENWRVKSHALAKWVKTGNDMVGPAGRARSSAQDIRGPQRSAISSGSISRRWTVVSAHSQDWPASIEVLSLPWRMDKARPSPEEGL